MSSSYRWNCFRFRFFVFPTSSICVGIVILLCVFPVCYWLSVPVQLILSGMNRLWNDRLCVKWDDKAYELTYPWPRYHVQTQHVNIFCNYDLEVQKLQSSKLTLLVSKCSNVSLYRGLVWTLLCPEHLQPT